jgi:hypothetical protein
MNMSFRRQRDKPSATSIIAPCCANSASGLLSLTNNNPMSGATTSFLNEIY